MCVWVCVHVETHLCKNMTAAGNLVIVGTFRGSAGSGRVF